MNWPLVENSLVSTTSLAGSDGSFYNKTNIALTFISGALSPYLDFDELVALDGGGGGGLPPISSLLLEWSVQLELDRGGSEGGAGVDLDLAIASIDVLG